ncbi:MAG: hypothetical protein Q8R91_03155 [Candidatus Omnitrophota bacterium]|nr:hypothetical protein [Candidatus Omnitrophota bacterium]
MIASATPAEPRRWLERYAALTELMYEVRRLCPRLPVLGLSTVHPRHAVPPDHLWLMGPAPLTLPSPLGLVARWVRCVLFAARESLGLLWVKPQVWRDLRRLTREPATVILKTWGFGPEALHRTEDFYYGTLPQQLEARGISCLVLCGDTRERLDTAFAKTLLRRPTIRTVPEQLLVPIWAPLVTAVRQFATAVALRRLAQRAEQPSLARVAAAACLDSLQPITVRNILHFSIARKAVKTWGAKVFVTLYEGQPWEKPAWHGAKAAEATCVTVGYQHTVIMPHSLSLLSPNRNSWERSTPDVVLCLGEIPLQMMASGHQPLGSRLVSFGTFRRSDHHAPAAPSPQFQRRTVLVVPETGVIREAKLLFNFAMQAASLATDHRFILRCHPAMPFHRLRPHLAGEPSALPNMEVSDRPSIGEDFARSSVVLYRGSSAVLYAVLHGLKPIYLQDADYPDVDPLFEVTGWRERVDSPEAMSEALQQYLTVDEAQAMQQWRRTVEYVNRYTRAVDAAAIDRFLQAVGCPGASVG